MTTANMARPSAHEQQAADVQLDGFAFNQIGNDLFVVVCVSSTTDSCQTHNLRQAVFMQHTQLGAVRCTLRYVADSVSCLEVYLEV